MYGQAVLLRHVSSKKVTIRKPVTCMWVCVYLVTCSPTIQLLRCLATSPTGDKMAYNIGFTDNPDRSEYTCSFAIRSFLSILISLSDIIEWDCCK